MAGTASAPIDLSVFACVISHEVYIQAKASYKGDPQDSAALAAHVADVADKMVIYSSDTFWENADNDVDGCNPLVVKAQESSVYMEQYKDEVPAVKAFLKEAVIRDFYALWHILTTSSRPQQAETEDSASCMVSQLVRDVALAAGIGAESPSACDAPLRT